MTDTLRELLIEYDKKQYATDTGTLRHRQMQSVYYGDGVWYGDVDIVNQIQNHPELCVFFNENSRTEVPVAGVLCGKFISRRIDRLFVDAKEKTVYVLDYKTDIDKTIMYDKYIWQLREYKELLRQVYPKYQIVTYLLWLHDWTLELIK